MQTSVFKQVFDYDIFCTTTGFDKVLTHKFVFSTVPESEDGGTIDGAMVMGNSVPVTYIKVMGLLVTKTLYFPYLTTYIGLENFYAAFLDLNTIVGGYATNLNLLTQDIITKLTNISLTTWDYLKLIDQDLSIDADVDFNSINAISATISGSANIGAAYIAGICQCSNLNCLTNATIGTQLNVGTVISSGTIAAQGLPSSSIIYSLNDVVYGRMLRSSGQYQNITTTNPDEWRFYGVKNYIRVTTVSDYIILGSGILDSTGSKIIWGIEKSSAFQIGQKIKIIGYDPGSICVRLGCDGGSGLPYNTFVFQNGASYWVVGSGHSGGVPAGAIQYYINPGVWTTQLSRVVEAIFDGTYWRIIG